MSGNSTVIMECPQCKHINTPRGKAHVLAMTCAKCNLYIKPNSTIWEKFKDSYAPVLPLGTKGKIKEVTYEVMGFIVRRERRFKYRWREYVLFNPYQGVLYLSEYDGHWNALRPNPKHPWLKEVADEEPVTREGIFKLYSKFKADVVYARGEFFNDILEGESAEHFEYINPPYLLTCERDDQRFESFYGKYISGDEIAKGFGISIHKFPEVKGMGYTQPLVFSFNEKMMVKITVLFMALALIILLISNNRAEDKLVFKNSFDQASLNEQKMFTTSSFHLDGGRKNLVLQVSAPISNDWFFAEYALINEKTEEEIVFTKELEYYSGYESGESWSEGSPYGEAFLSSIPEGDYHVNIYPEFSGTSHSFDVAIWHDTPYISNFLIFAFLIAVFPTCFYIYKYHKDKSRWSDSEYSPYDYEE